MCRAALDHSCISVSSALLTVPTAQTLDRWPSPLRALSLKPYKCSSWETGPSGSGRYHPRFLISGVCCFVFPFAVAQEPKHLPLLSCMVKWPGPVPGCFARWLDCGGCCVRWADNTPQCWKQDTPPSCSRPASARQPAALSWPVRIWASLLR